MTAVAVPLSIETFLFANRIQLQLCGELDIATAPLLQDRLASAFSAGPTHVVLDVSGLDFVDSSGAALFLSAHKRSVSEGVDLSIRGARPQFLQLLQVTGLVDLLDVVPRGIQTVAAVAFPAD